MRSWRTLAVGVGVFLALAPLLACARQGTLLLVASALSTSAALVEVHLLPSLPVDPVYGGAGLRVLGGIDPRGLAVAGWPGLWLHALAPALFGSPTLVADGAAVSALVAPDLTVLARVLAAILATSVLVALAGLAAERLRQSKRWALAVTARLGLVWLLLDLVHETRLSIRDLEATGLPFALAALAPVDAHGQRILLTGQLDGVPPVVIGGVNALLAIGGCLLLAWLLLAAIRRAWRAPRQLCRLVRITRLVRAGRLPHRLLVPTLPRASLPRLHLPALTPAAMAAGLSTGALRLTKPTGLALLAVALHLTPLRTLAEGEIAIAPVPAPMTAGASAEALPAEPTPQPPAPHATAQPTPGAAASQPLATSAPATTGAVVAGPAASAPTSSAIVAAPIAAPSPVAVASSAAPSAASTTAPTLASASPAPSLAAGPAGSRVILEGGNYRYTLRVDGRPWVIRGMGYNPWYASLSTAERQQYYRRDFSLMRETGINTLEGWFQDQFDEVTLDEAHRQGLKVIMPFELNQDYDYADPAIQARFRAEVTAWVIRYRDHPAVLMWGPGNEVLHRLIFPTAVQGKRDPAREQRADDFARFYVELMDLIHELDPHHPVVYRDAEDLYLARFLAQLEARPAHRPWFVYGTNVYTSRIAEVIERWPSRGLDAPLLVSEFSPGGAGPADRPRMLGWYWSTIRSRPELVLGGVVYTWATRGPEDLDRVFGLTDESGAPVDGSLGALRQLFRPASAVSSGPH